MVTWKRRGVEYVAEINGKTVKVHCIPGSQKLYASVQNPWSTVSWTCVAAADTAKAAKRLAEQRVS